MKRNSSTKIALAGLISGFLNGLFGSGGGVAAVMFLRPMLKDEKKAHASATLMILVMSAVSFVLYAVYGQIEWGRGLMFVPGGIVGALLGSAFLKNIKADILHRVFGAVLIISGAVMLLI
ncbi:MAG: sulfite exporter TauE/SafE family protein [Oscillospiraceae bacterium]